MLSLCYCFLVCLLVFPDGFERKYFCRNFLKVYFRICSVLVLLEKSEMGTHLKAGGVALADVSRERWFEDAHKDLLVSTVTCTSYKYAASTWVSQHKIPTSKRSKA